jgi:ATP-dependent DNA helicase 2 subunit 2
LCSGIDFDDADYGFKEEDKPSRKADNEKTLEKLVELCKNGVYGTMAQAVEELSVPRIKPVRPFKTYDGPLTLGDPENPNSMSIAVERYFKTKQAHAPSATTVVVKPEHNGGPSQAQEADEMEGVEMTGGGFSGVKQVRTYKVNDPDAPGGKKDVEFESLSKGYMYGRTVVPISESDQNVTKLETKKGFTILGFIPWESVSSLLHLQRPPFQVLS